MSSTELAVSGYIRELQNSLNMQIPSDIWLIIIMFHPKYIEFPGNTMNLTMDEKKMITSWFMDIFTLKHETALSSELLYSSNYTENQNAANEWHESCDGNINTFSIIETEHNGHIFGCFLSKKLVHNTKSAVSIRYGETKYIIDDKAFLCVIRSRFKDKETDPGPDIFRVQRSAFAYYNAESWGPAFGSSDLTLMYFGKNNCNHQRTFFDTKLRGNRLCGGDKYDEKNIEREYDIKDMNTFTIKVAIENE